MGNSVSRCSGVVITWGRQVPVAEHINDVTVVTTIVGKDGVVKVTVATSAEYSGTGETRLSDIEVDLRFRVGSA